MGAANHTSGSTVDRAAGVKRMHCGGACKAQGIFDADKHGAPLWSCRCCGHLHPFGKAERAEWDAAIAKAAGSTQ